MKEALTIACGMQDEQLLSAAHFGDAQYYQLYRYDVATGKIEALGQKHLPAITERHHGDKRKAGKVGQYLAEADVLLAHEVGPNVQHMQKRFAVVLSAERQIEWALQQLQAEKELLLQAFNGGKRIVKLKKRAG